MRQDSIPARFNGELLPETNYLGGGSVFLMTLYHFHETKYEDEANAWLVNFLLRYNDLQHRSEPHSRMEDWLENLPSSGVRALCSWERFCTFAREPERRKVGGDTRISVAGVNYEVDPDLAGETVMLWWGIFDNELYIEHGDKRFGPYSPIGGPIPLHRYRAFKVTDGVTSSLRSLRRNFPMGRRGRVVPNYEWLSRDQKW